MFVQLAPAAEHRLPARGPSLTLLLAHPDALSGSEGTLVEAHGVLLAPDESFIVPISASNGTYEVLRFLVRPNPLLCSI